ncbi:cation/H(+) antiporter 2-like [Rutidosis leptorrhynchoides]|uniref:cation/H(+) antiporter 2-like n=1 Tax=Rutidosis leptorrhynchoides TaxID=125765 RepID=UPI003A99BECA
MDFTSTQFLCTEGDHFNPVVTTVMQMSGILVISQIFHLILKPLGQPGPIAQILAGLVLGPMLLSRIETVRSFFLQDSSKDYFQLSDFLCRVIFMFLIGLETDFMYMWRNFGRASTVAYGGIFVCAVFGASVSFYLIHQLGIVDNKPGFYIVVMVILANSASPVAIRLAAELKFETSDIGRLAIGASLINEMSCIMFYSVFYATTKGSRFSVSLSYLFYTVLLIIANHYAAYWINRRNRAKKYISNAEVLLFLVVIVGMSMFIENGGFNSTLFYFIMGITFPREGKTTRTLLQKLSYSVHNFILPIYFGYAGFQFDISRVDLKEGIVIMVMILLSISGKIIGTLAACHYLKMLQTEAIFLAAILNLKGHADLLLIQNNSTAESLTWWGPEIRSLFVVIIVINTIITGPTAAYIMKREEKFFCHSQTSLEMHDLETELRMMACVYGARNVNGAVNLISALTGSQVAPITPYLVHLVELPKRRKTKNLLYNQLEDKDQFSDEEDFGGNDVMEINEVVDHYTLDTKNAVRRAKLVSSAEALYEDVCNSAEDLRLSIIFLPFHKHQRIDGRLETTKESIRTTNSKVLRHAPCSVGILVDRWHTGFQQPHATDLVQHVAALFFGGPDDREALACSKRIADHSRLNLTVIRFLPSLSSKEQTPTMNTGETAKSSSSSYSQSNKDEVLMAISTQESETELDNCFMDEFYGRYVSTGLVGYIEKHVHDGTETAAALRDVGDTYSLYIVGKGGRNYSPMTTGMSDWEECPELGTVGDLLASVDFDVHGSVLVIQQHRRSRNYR